MTISTYAELKTACVNWYEGRSDLADYADEFIDLAEAYFNQRIRHRKMETVTTLSPTANVYTLPSNYIEYKRVVEDASTRRRLEYITEDMVDVMYADRASGVGCNFTIIGDSLYVYPFTDNDVELTYYAAIPALSGSNTTNWLLTKAPALYLHACRHYAAIFVEDADKAAREAAIVTQFISLLHSEDNRAKFANVGMNFPGVVW